MPRAALGRGKGRPDDTAAIVRLELVVFFVTTGVSRRFVKSLPLGVRYLEARQGATASFFHVEPQPGIVQFALVQPLPTTKASALFAARPQEPGSSALP